MARGEMVRYMAENHIEDLEDIKNFDRLGYAYAEPLSDQQTYVFFEMKNVEITESSGQVCRIEIWGLFP